MSHPSLKLVNYNISDDPDEVDSPFEYNEEIRAQLQKSYEAIGKRNRNIIVNLKKLIKKYPGVPIFLNYLAIAYEMAGKVDKAFEVTQKTYEKFPDYLMGRINLAKMQIKREEFDQVPELLGESLELQSLCPERKTFHISEVVEYFGATAEYLIATNEIENAKKRLKIIEKLAPDHPTLQKLEIAILDKRLENSRRYSDQHERNIQQARIAQTDTAPTFTHPEVEVLYQKGLDIEPEVIEQLLALPRETLIKDLLTVLWDAAKRYEYFKKEISKEGWNEDTHNFSLHAFSLLSELKATEALPDILEFWKQDDEIMDFWFSDLITEIHWEFFYHLGNKQLETLKAFMLTPNIETYHKNSISESVYHVALYQPERRGEVIEWYQEVLAYMLEAKDNPAVSDPSLNGLIIWDILENLRAPELLPFIKELYDADLVDQLMLNSYDSIEAEMLEKGGDPEGKTLHANTIELYRYLSNWGEPVEKELFSPKTQDTSPTQKFEPGHAPVIRSTVKIGRNEPCPCGSGKKYKKCCWNKDH